MLADGPGNQPQPRHPFEVPDVAGGKGKVVPEADSGDERILKGEPAAGRSQVGEGLTRQKGAHGIQRKRAVGQQGFDLDPTPIEVSANAKLEGRYCGDPEAAPLEKSLDDIGPWGGTPKEVDDEVRVRDYDAVRHPAHA